MSTWSSATWHSAEFHGRLRAFVESAIGADVEIEPVSIRPWSAVWQVSASGVLAFVKQNCPGQAHEARLMGILARQVPDRVVPVLAADPDHDLLLTERIGPTLREAGRRRDVDQWCGIVVDAVGLQRATLGSLAQAGLSEMVPCDATTYVANAVGRLAALPAGDPRQLPVEDAVRLEALLPAIEGWADEVDALDLPMALVHNDLHDGNAVVDADGQVRFFDFGDAVLGHPLTNLLIPLRVAADELGAAPGDPRLRRIADAGTEAWSDLSPLADLRAALPAALRLACLARVESWRRCVAAMLPHEQAEYGGAPAAWLGMLLAEPPVQHSLGSPISRCCAPPSGHAGGVSDA